MAPTANLRYLYVSTKLNQFYLIWTKDVPHWGRSTPILTYAKNQIKVMFDSPFCEDCPLLNNMFLTFKWSMFLLQFAQEHGPILWRYKPKNHWNLQLTVYQGCLFWGVFVPILRGSLFFCVCFPCHLFFPAQSVKRFASAIGTSQPRPPFWLPRQSHGAIAVDR